MKQNKTLLILALGVFGIATTEFGVVGILPQLAAAFQISIAKAGWLLSAFAIAVAVSGPFMMTLLSSFDRKKLMAIALLIFAISNMLSALAKDFEFLLIARILPAFFHPVYWSIALTAAANAVPEKDSTKAVSMVFGGFTIASIIGVPLATLAADLFSWQASFILSAIINIISLLGLMMFLPPVLKIETQHTYSKTLLLKKPVLWVSLLLSFLMITAMYTTYGYMADYLRSVARMNGTQISAMLFLFGITGVQGNLLAGKLMGHSGYKTTFVFIISLAVVHYLLSIVGHSFLLMVILIGIWGFVHTAGFVISNVTVTAAGKEAPEFINSIFTTCGNAGVTAGAMLGGVWITRYGVQQVIWASIICLLASIVILLIKRKWGY